jgi:hypothetical protein
MITDVSLGKVIASQREVSLSPNDPVSAKKYPIIFAHGAEGDAGASAWMGLTSRWGVFTGAIDYGKFFGVSADMGGSATWGNNTVIEAMDSAFSFMQANPFVLTGKVNIVAQSMGAASAMAFAGRFKSKVNKIVLVIPVLNISDIRSSSSYQSAIDTAYGGTWSEINFGADHNPLTMSANGKFSGIPIQVWYGTTDTLCKPEYSTQFISNCSGAIGMPLAGGHAETTVASVDGKAVGDFLNS